MASIYALKGRFQALLRPLVRGLFAAGVTANQVTLVAGLGSLAVAAWVALRGGTQPWVFAALPLWMFLRMALNAIDGMLAREHGQQSRLGAYLNELCDVVSDSALYLALLAVPGVAPWTLLLFAGLAALTEFAGVLGPSVGAPRRYDGPMGKSDRAFWFGLLGLLIAFDAAAPLLHGVAALVAVLSAWTVVNRLRQALRACAPATP